MRLCKAFVCWVLLVCVPITVFALGLGTIKLESALNEPFAAEVSLDSVGNAKLDEIYVSLASADSFDRNGLDKPAFLSDFRFSVEENSAGQPVVRITSASAVAEPFVTILLDVRWASGRLLREYTVLLDPPLFENTTVQPALTPAEMQVPLESVTMESAAAESATSELQEAAREPMLEPLPPEVGVAELPQEVENEPQPEPMAVEAEPASQPAPTLVVSYAPSTESAEPSGDYTTRRGDTLWGIASRSGGEQGLTTNQMMLAIYRANPEAFLGNINALKAGAILRLPAPEEASELSISEANVEVIKQHSTWAGASAGSTAPVAQLQLVAPTDSETVGDASGFAAGDDRTSARATELEAELDETQRLLQVKDVELQSLQQRIAELELQSAEEPPLGETPFEIDDEAPESDTEIVVERVDELSESPFADDAELLEDDLLAVDEDGGQVRITPVEEPAQPRPDQVVDLADDDSASFIGELLSSYWLWGAGVFVVLVALFFVRRRTGSGDADATSFWEADEDVAPDAPLRDFSDLPSADTSFVVDEVDDALAEDLAEPAPVQEPKPEPEAEPIFDEAAETVVRQAFDDEASPDIDESEPQAEQASEALDDVIDFDDFDSGELTTNLEVLQAANADADQDDDSETPLEKTISAGAPLNLDQADPIAEAEFHMAYGLYDQAADLLVKALDKEPDNREQRVKLVEVYFVWENREGFLAQATALREAISDDGDADWNKVLILGKQLCPEAELFSGAAASSPTADAMDLELGEDVGEMDLDFALGGTGIKASEGAALADDDAGLDLDIGAAGEDESEHEDASDLDLSLAGTEIKASDVAALADDDAGLDLNIGAVGEDEGEGLAPDLGPEDESAEGDAEGDDGSLFAPDPGGDEGASVDDAVADDDGLAVTTEAPTLESPMLGGEAEPPALDIDLGATDAGSTMESPTLQLPDSNSETAEMRGLDESVLDATALDDPTAFNVDLSGLADFEEGSSVDIADDEPTVLAKTGDFSKLEAAMDSDTVEQPRLETSAHGDTAEQPEIAVDDWPDLDDSASIVPRPTKQR